MTLVGASSDPDVIGRDEVPTKSHYFMGSDPTKWQTDIPNYAKVEYQEVYPGVDLVYYGNQRRLEYDFVVSPGADPSVIRLAFEGVDQLRVDDRGDLVLRVGRGEIRQHKPVVYQDIDGVRREISGSYLVRDRQQVTFQVGDYDASRPLTIDPVLVYSMILGPDESGTQALHGGLDIAVDADGSAFVTGRLGGGDDAFVAKVNADGTNFVYLIALAGGSNPFGEDSGRIAVDAAGDVYVVGTTADPNFFTTPNAYQPEFGLGSLDAYVAKFHGTNGASYYSGSPTESMGAIGSTKVSSLCWREGTCVAFELSRRPSVALSVWHDEATALHQGRSRQAEVHGQIYDAVLVRR